MKRNKTAVIEVSDDESKSSVKKGAEPSTSQEVLELQQKLAKSEKDKLGAIRIAGEAQARVEFLENLIDKKRVSQQDEREGSDKKLVEELQKKIEELTKENEMARRKSTVTDGSEKTIAAVQEKEASIAANDEETQSLNGVSMVPNFTHQVPIEPKEELKEEEMLDDFMNGSEHSSATDSIAREEVGEKSTNVRSNKNIPKKRKSPRYDSKAIILMRKHRAKKMNSTELKCPECEYRTRFAAAWLKHLPKSHSRTPTIAGVALLCDCGQESRSVAHLYKCGVANFTVITKSYAKKTITPQCVLCEKFPNSMNGYRNHLQLHKTSLKENNIYLKCSCGFEYYNHNYKKFSEHNKKCISRQFTLHKLEKK